MGQESEPRHTTHCHQSPFNTPLLKPGLPKSGASKSRILRTRTTLNDRPSRKLILSRLDTPSAIGRSAEHLLPVNLTRLQRIHKTVTCRPTPTVTVNENRRYSIIRRNVIYKVCGLSEGRECGNQWLGRLHIYSSWLCFVEEYWGKKLDRLKNVGTVTLGPRDQKTLKLGPILVVKGLR